MECKLHPGPECYIESFRFCTALLPSESHGKGRVLDVCAPTISDGDGCALQHVCQNSLATRLPSQPDLGATLISYKKTFDFEMWAIHVGLIHRSNLNMSKRIFQKDD